MYLRTVYTCTDQKLSTGMCSTLPFCLGTCPEFDKEALSFPYHAVQPIAMTYSTVGFLQGNEICKMHSGIPCSAIVSLWMSVKVVERTIQSPNPAGPDKLRPQHLITKQTGEVASQLLAVLTSLANAMLAGMRWWQLQSGRAEGCLPCRTFGVSLSIGANVASEHKTRTAPVTSLSSIFVSTLFFKFWLFRSHDLLFV